MVGNMIRVLRARMTLLAVDEAGMSTVDANETIPIRTPFGPARWFRANRGFAPARRGMSLVASVWGLRSGGVRPWPVSAGPVYEPLVAVGGPAGRPLDRSL